MRVADEGEGGESRESVEDGEGSEDGVGDEGGGQSSFPVPINQTYVCHPLNERGKSCRPFADEMQQIVAITSPAVLLDSIC